MLPERHVKDNECELLLAWRRFLWAQALVWLVRAVPAEGRAACAPTAFCCWERVTELPLCSCGVGGRVILCTKPTE